MNNHLVQRLHARRVWAIVVVACAAFLTLSQSITASSWNGIEPLKSRRVDVERILGQPLKDQPGEEGTLHFKVAGGIVTVAFVDARFVATKKLSRETEGTVRQVVLQHEHSSDTPEPMGLNKKSEFTRDASGEVIKYSNLKEGVVYTFIGGKLKSTYYTPSSSQWSRMQKG